MTCTQPTRPISRRSLIAASALGLVAAAARPIRGEPTLAVPEVDSLSLQVIVDSGTFGPFLPNLDLPAMKVVRAGNGGPMNLPQMLPNALTGEFGLSILGESQRGDVRRRVLVDFGYSAAQFRASGDSNANAAWCRLRS
jgi:7,8-dihydropterin-6-yl-methyl-4-(beta-D-ribofuranosyl)aminobenzene 5'-phosphate synthase